MKTILAITALAALPLRATEIKRHNLIKLSSCTSSSLVVAASASRPLSTGNQTFGPGIAAESMTAARVLSNVGDIEGEVKS